MTAGRDSRRAEVRSAVSDAEVSSKTAWDSAKSSGTGAIGAGVVVILRGFEVVDFFISIDNLCLIGIT